MFVEDLEQAVRHRAELTKELLTYFGSMAEIELSPDDDIFALGLVNSLRALEIVVHIENTYGIAVEVDDLELDNFRSAARAAAFVERKRGGVSHS
ncbi:acyl carrier protein [Nocardia huaxiensis]|uniref:Acyl carrier protein n=1 Tax=Nocardia huaxiensis TaxID=2755382 RepID=A0A7D6VF78_9NOCA|nr:acyl carrier protein [Nocardia huaxiensis]QLY28170.1 acyl carrier protein [Nocardia huaxiensis]UFS98384.1 acyl carrier protein [Nocardia huaxiensis]